MYKIREKYENEIVINKSRFIGIIMPIDDNFDIKSILKDINKEYPKATHYCYAYILKNKEKSNDDGEPSGTAGRPILEVIKNNELNDVLLVVVRYFGGIKLGAGGLVRAYVNSAKEVIDKAEIFKVEMHNIYEVSMDYSLYDPIRNYLQKCEGKIIDTSFDENITINYLAKEINEDDLNEISKGKLKIVSKNQKEVYINMCK